LRRTGVLGGVVLTEQDRVDEDVFQEESPATDGDSNDVTSANEQAEAASTDGDVGHGPLDDLFLSPEDSDVEVVSAPEIVEVPDEEGTGALVAELRAQLAAAEIERGESKNRHLRTAADLENFRKRTAREREDMRKYGIDKVVLELLPVIDNLDRALEHAEKSDPGVSSIIDGVRMVYRQFVTALEKHGVSSFDARGEAFDPTRHEAIQQIESAEQPANTVLEQYQKGYFLHDRLIRPALVAVSKKVEVSGTPEPEPEPAEAADVEADPVEVVVSVAEVEVSVEAAPDLEEVSANEQLAD
jgi:molecular chaperone GrpE